MAEDQIPKFLRIILNEEKKNYQDLMRCLTNMKRSLENMQVQNHLAGRKMNGVRF